MASIAVRSRPSAGAERRFYFFMGATILALIFIGFAPSYYLRGLIAPTAPMLPMTPLVHLHGLVFSAWVMLFMAQVSLVSARRTDLHRKLGLLGFVLVAAMIVVGTLAALHGVERASGPPVVPPLAWLAVPLLDIPVFGGLIAFALYHRRNPQVHKRLMLSATVGLLSPAVGRMPWFSAVPMPLVIIGSLLLFMAALAVWDLRSQGRIHRVTVIATAVLVGSWIFRFAIWQTEPWLAFAGWAASLV